MSKFKVGDLVRLVPGSPSGRPGHCTTSWRLGIIAKFEQDAFFATAPYIYIATVILFAPHATVRVPAARLSKVEVGGHEI